MSEGIMKSTQFPLTRRAMLGSSAALGVSVVTSPLAFAATVPAKDTLRLALSPASSGKAPMNAANLAPALERVLQVQQALTQKLNQDVSFVHRRDVIKDELSETRALLAQFMGVADVDDLALVRNTSEANSIIVNGIDLEGGEVLVWSENHPTSRHSWQYRKARTADFSYREFTLPAKTDSAQAIVEFVRQQVRPNTRVVCFSEISNISGMRLPAEALCKAIHEVNPKIFVHVDGAQSLGNIDVRLDKMGCDAFSASGHKWLMGPRGTGILYVRPEWARKIWPATLGYDVLFDYPLDELPDSAQRFECFGQRDIAAVTALGEVVRTYQEIGGITAVSDRIQALTGYGIEALKSRGLSLLTPNNPELRQGIIVVNVGGAINAYGAFLALHNAGIASAFIKGDRVCCSPDEMSAGETEQHTYLRLSPHIYNDEKEIDRAVEIIARIVESKFEIIKEVVRFL